MYPPPIQADHLGDHRLLVKFADGTRAELDFAPMVEWGGIFERLRDPAYFGKVMVDAEGATLAWPGGVDICPDVLYHLATGAPLPGELPRRAANLVRVDRSTSAA